MRRHAEAHRLFSAGQGGGADTKRGLKSFKSSFSEKALTQNQKAPANADHRHRTCQGAGCSSRDLDFINNSKQTAASPGGNIKGLFWNRSAAHYSVNLFWS